MYSNAGQAPASLVTKEDVLNYLVNSVNIDTTAIEKKIEMDKKEKFVNDNHCFKITQGKDGRWRTHILIGDNRKLIAKTRKEDLIDALFSFYERIDNGSRLTFKQVFDRYQDYKTQVVSPNTIFKYKADFKRYFEATDFSKRIISEIAKEDCITFIVQTITNLKLTKRPYESLYGYLSGTFDYAKSQRYITENPMEFVKRRDYFRYCVPTYIDPEDRVISDDEMKRIMDVIQRDHNQNPRFITVYAVEFAMLTGMRVGELSTLTWEDIDFGKRTLRISKGEIYDQHTNVMKIGTPKNNKIRVLPLTDRMIIFLRNLYEVERQAGFLCEYVFANKNGRISKNAISKCAFIKCKQAGLEKSKNIHAYRRTLNSKLHMIGASTAIAAAMLGHTEEVNLRDYSYDVSDIDVKRGLLEKAQPDLF